MEKITPLAKNLTLPPAVMALTNLTSACGQDNWKLVQCTGVSITITLFSLQVHITTQNTDCRERHLFLFDQIDQIAHRIHGTLSFLQLILE